MAEQIPFGTDDFAENPEPRVPCLLLLDVSGSMAGTKIDELRRGLEIYKNELAADAMTSKRVEISVITFGGTINSSDWATADVFTLPELKPEGATPMGEAIVKAIDLLKQRKSTYRANGVLYYRPWIFLITDGEPTDQWSNAAQLIKAGEKKKEFSFFTVGVEGANMDKLKDLSVREPLKLKGLQFSELFLWLSSSQQSVSRSQPGDEVLLASPAGWAAI
jgi:uncharacterized protein YegL